MAKRKTGKASASSSKKGNGPSKKGAKAPWSSPIPRGLSGDRGGTRR